MHGRVAAGVLHEAVEQDERVDFEAMFNKKSMFVLQVTGDSMIDAHIEDGDYVVIRKAKDASPVTSSLRKPKMAKPRSSIGIPKGSDSLTTCE